MQNFRYPARLKSDGDTLGVTFRDVPEAITWGCGLEDALWQAADCLEEAIAGRLRRGDPVPVPSKIRRGEVAIDLPARTAAKAALYAAMKETGVRSSQLARRLKCEAGDIERLLDPRQTAKLSKIEEALHALGKRLMVAVDEAA